LVQTIPNKFIQKHLATIGNAESLSRAMSKHNERINEALGKHSYNMIKTVGQGSYGAAVLVQHTSDKAKDTKAIVKMIDLSRASKQEKDDALKESGVLSSLKHPYIVRYRESFHEDGWLCIVMDYCEGGDLSEYLKKVRNAGKSLPQEQVVRWFTQSILALKYIHDLHVLHRDLKSGNFFLSKSGNIKLGDFGIAKVLECTAAVAKTQIGTPYYLSPEICKGEPYAWGSDVWSMGCILYELCSLRVPFDAADLRALIQRITSGSVPELPAGYSDALRNLYRELLDRDPSKRPPAADILKRPVIQEMVRKMLDEVKGDEESATSSSAVGGGSAGGVGSASGSVGGSEARVSGGAGARAVSTGPAAGKYASTAGSYEKGAGVEYYSATHGEWLPASVTGVDPDGRIMLNVKPNVWISIGDQGAKVRPRTSSGANRPAGRAPSQPRKR